MKIKIRHIAPVIFIFFIVGIAGTMALNLWSSEQIKEPARFASGKFEGQYDPSDIRGSFTLADINKAFKVPVEDLAEAFGFKDAPDPEAIKAKDIEETYGALKGGELGTDSVRMFVSYYLGLPFTTTEDSLLPKQAISILNSKGKITAEQLKDLEEMSVDLAALKGKSDTSTVPSEPISEEHEDEVAFSIKGKTTFQELLDNGITREEIEKILGMPMGRSGDSIRNYVAEKGLEFSVFKPELEALVKAKR